MISIQSWTQEIDKLSRVYLMLASDNTWQGIVFNKWPYSKAPPLIEQKFVTNAYKMAHIHLEENLWKSRNGYGDFNKCVEDKDDEKCVSIFDITFDKSTKR